MMTFHHASPIIRLNPAPTQYALSNREHGTRVTVRDLFGNMPVRIKQRTDAWDSKRRDGDLMRALKAKVVGLMIAWGRPVNLELTSALSSTHLHLREPNNSKSSQHSRVPTGLDLSLVQRVLTQATYTDHVARGSWVGISARTRHLSLQGAVCLKPSPNKVAQFVSLGIEPLKSHSLGDVLLCEVNRLFTLSAFGAQEGAFGAEVSDLHGQDGRHKPSRHTERELKMAGKAVDRWPSFVIRIDIRERRSPSMSLESSLVNSQSMQEKMVKILRATITKFLEDHNFKPRLMPHPQREKPTPFSNRGVLPLEFRQSPFSTWSRIKSGVSQNFSDVRHWNAVPNPPSNNDDARPSLKKDVTGSSEDKEQGQSDLDQNRFLLKAGQASTSRDASVIWHDPITNAPILINGRTGLSVPAKKCEPLSTQRASEACKVSGPRANDGGHLEAWKNPVFSPAEGNIPRIFRFGRFAGNHGHTLAHKGDDLDRMHALSVSDAKLSKQALRTAKVIAQVDQKFVLVHMSTEAHGMSANECNTGRMLVLIDQHAADERIRVEQLFFELCTAGNGPLSYDGMTTSIPSTPLPSALVFQITAQESSLFGDSQRWFAEWGIVYNIRSADQHHLTESAPDVSSHLFVQCLPPLIAERCRKQPKVLIDLLRQEIWDPLPRNTSTRPDSTRAAVRLPCPDEDLHHRAETPRWLTKIHRMPRGLLDMLHSRACRSAVMFNDRLSLEESQVLVRTLASTKFPFQCAHGRPSLVPLVGIGSLGQADVESFDLKRAGTMYENESFLGAYRASLVGKGATDV